jgi:hypothetical protein
MTWGHKNDRDAAMTADNISETTTYVMWREEHLWNVNVLQRVHFSKLVYTGLVMDMSVDNIAK